MRWRNAIMAAALALAPPVGSVAAAVVGEDEARALIERCAPDVHPSTLMAVLKTESSLRPYAINVNGEAAQQILAQSKDEAVDVAQHLIASGINFDAGLGQINVSNFGWLELTPQTVFDPCRNVAAAGAVLEEAFGRLHTTARDEQAALDASLSVYNTGHRERGVINGYVERVREYAVPALMPRPDPQHAEEHVPEWDVFSRREKKSVFQQ